MMELMIVVVIVAVLIALAYPSYVQYMRKAKRSEAQQLLMNWSINQEIWRSNHTTYDDGTNITEPQLDDYDFVVSNTSATTYTLTAEAENDQLNDKAKDGTYCGKPGSLLQMTQTGAKTPAACWD